MSGEDSEAATRSRERLEGIAAGAGRGETGPPPPPGVSAGTATLTCRLKAFLTTPWWHMVGSLARFSSGRHGDPGEIARALTPHDGGAVAAVDVVFDGVYAPSTASLRWP